MKRQPMSAVTMDTLAFRDPANRWKARREPGREPDRPDDGDATFAALRRNLFGIACRVLGTSVEAEDVVQETWLRWQKSDRTAVRNPAAFLATTATRLA